MVIFNVQQNRKFNQPDKENIFNLFTVKALRIAQGMFLVFGKHDSQIFVTPKIILNFATKISVKYLVIEGPQER